MIKLIIISAIFLLSLQRRNNVLGCGLIGFVPKKKQEGNLNWLKLIMSYNTIRGTDSCGIFINNSVIKGIDKRADIRVLLANTALNYDDNCKNKVVIAHTRKSTRGGNTLNNCHPFEVSNGKKTLILAHNGTISNIYDLAKKYDISHDGLFVDSHILAKIILEKGYDVLNHYQGGAALLFTYSDEPNVLYVFKGASRQYSTQKEEEEERPLNFVENHEGYYISSLWEPLDACTNQEEISYTFNENELTRIENGKFEVIYKADRSQVNIYKAPVHVPAKKDETVGGASTNKSFSNEVILSLVKNTKIIVKTSDIYDECTTGMYVRNIMRDSIYYMGGRYYSFNNRNLTEGNLDFSKPYCPSDGIEKYLLRGSVACKVLSKYIFEVFDSKHSNHWPQQSVSMFYFYEGVLINPLKEMAFKKIEENLNKERNPLAKLNKLSNYSKYPITFLYSESKPLKPTTIRYYLNNKLADPGEFQPLFSGRKYKIGKKGFLKSIDSFIDKDPIMINGTFPSTIILPTVETEVLNNYDATTLFHEITTKINNIFVDYKIERYSGQNTNAESELILEEELNGISEVYYYVDENWSDPISGGEMIKKAIELYLLDVGTFGDDITNPEFVSYVDLINDEALQSGQGVLSFMATRWGCGSFESFIKTAIEEEAEKIVNFVEEVELEEEAEDLLNENKVQNIILNNFKNEKGNETFSSL